MSFGAGRQTTEDSAGAAIPSCWWKNLKEHVLSHSLTNVQKLEVGIGSSSAVFGFVGCFFFLN